jgi:hypothetical protein
LPYPTRFGLWRAAASPAPFLAITNRMVIVRWTESDGRRRTLLFEPSDVELGTNAPYFAALAEKTPKLVADPLVTIHGDVLGRLAGAGIAPDEVDYLVFNGPFGEGSLVESDPPSNTARRLPSSTLDIRSLREGHPVAGGAPLGRWCCLELSPSADGDRCRSYCGSRSHRPSCG